MSEVKTGFMHKCGKSVKSWKRRWFVLKANGYLYYYENKSSTHEKGKIDIVDSQRISSWFDVSTAERKLPNGMSPDRAIAIVCQDRTYTCVCEIDGESQSWINALNKVRGGSDQQYPAPTYSKDNQEQQKAQFEAPPPYTPTSVPPPPIGTNPQQQPYTQNSGTLPRSGAGAPPPQPIPRSNSFNPGAPSPQSSGSFVASPPTSGARPTPPGGPGYTHNYPVGNYRPPPNPNGYPPRAMPQPPPATGAYTPQQPVGYPPQAAAYPPRPPPASAYPPRPPPTAYPPRPPPASAYPPRPPPTAYPPRPPPAAAYPPRPPPSAYPPQPQPMYRPPPVAAPYQPPVRPGYQYRPPPPPQYYRPVQMNQSSTNVTVINLAAPTTKYVYR